MSVIPKQVSRIKTDKFRAVKQNGSEQLEEEKV